MTHPSLDFNDVPQVAAPRDGRDEIRAQLLDRLESVLTALFPAGRKRQGKFLIGDVLGSPGDSLEVVLTGEKAGLWTDRANNTGGDIFDLIAAHFRIDAHAEFPRVLDEAGRLLGRASAMPIAKPKKSPPIDDLGPATAKWDYLDADGQLIAVVYRYDPLGGKKEFRPWDAKRRKMAPPEPRPLYHQPGIAAADTVVLVEGEKCAQTLIDAGIVATTAMHGANAPVEKTDWSLLAGKTVVIWPDKDKPGWEYAECAAQAILAAGAHGCRILYPPEDKPEGWDAADAIAEGFDVAGFLVAGPCTPVRYAGDLLATQTAQAGDPAAGHGLFEDLDWTSEAGLARAFTRRNGQDWRYCAPWGKWLAWTGTRWNADQRLYVMHLAREMCCAAALMSKSPPLSRRLASAASIAAVERIARSEPELSSIPDEWDANLWALNTPGGVVDLRNGRLAAHRREDAMTRIATATPRGDCARWRAFLGDVTGGDAELQAYLQRMAGYCLTGATSAHALFFLYGTGANGKSVFVTALATILGDYATNAPMDTFMEARGDRHPTDLAGLRGARFVASVETEQGRRWNESKVKAITGGDKVSARFMRQDFFEYTPQFKLVIAGNHKPAIRNVDEAMKRRMHLIPFTVTIPPERRDPKLTEKLLAERDGILAWALAGCLQWQRRGLQPPASVLSATEEYFEAEDALGRWIDERCVRDANAKALTGELFNDWKAWAEAAGEFVGSQRRFSDQMVARGIEKWRNPLGVRGFQGIGLKVAPKVGFTPYADFD
ncbi:phage/plasmid primase, P4 family [Lysobacter hankyongensis]|uniref:SF3 helicase domain-containing protein n=1 Tax=Lysobacter hankyongensis TaxID=1176535 RepID=A0ABP9APE3_9GAMM